MKLSELIQKLQTELKEHGDLNVYFDIDCDGHGEQAFNGVEFTPKAKNAWTDTPEEEDRIVLTYGEHKAPGGWTIPA